MGGTKNYYFKIRSDILTALPEDISSVLSLGCGGGETEIRLKESGKVVYAVEREASFKPKLEKILDRVIIADLDQDRLDLPQDFFDCILLADILEHLRNPEAVLQGLKQYLKSGKYLVISAPNIRHASIIKDLLLGRWTYADAGILDRTHLRFFTLADLTKLFTRNGFELLHIRRKFIPLVYEHAKYRWQERLYPVINRIFNTGINPLLYIPWLREFFVYQYIVILKKAI